MLKPWLDEKLVAYRLLLAILLVAPFFWAINQEITVLLIELLSLPLIWIAYLHGGELLQKYKWPVSVVLVMLGLVALQLLPVPFSVWESLSGRDTFGELYDYLPGHYSEAWRTISVVPSLTEKAFLYLLPPVAVFLSVLIMDKTVIYKLLWVAFAVAVFQSFLGLVQYGGGLQLVDNILYTGKARGTYLNQDHLAGYLAMIFPVVLAMLASMIGHRHLQSGRSSKQRYWHFLATLKGSQSLLFAAIAVLIILCLIFTRSRSGLALLMIGMLFSLFAFSYRLGRSNIYGTYGTVIAIIIILAIEIGLAPILERFSVDPMQDLRWEIYAITIGAIGDYFPVGSGMGTFSSIYAAYQTPDLDSFINQAHNDYLQWILEGGLPMLLVLVFGLYCYFINWRNVWLSGQWGAFRFIQVGAGIGIFLVLLHSLFDFSLHKPANSIYFAFLLAIFFKDNQRTSRQDR